MPVTAQNHYRPGRSHMTSSLLISLLNCEMVAVTLLAGWEPQWFNPLHEKSTFKLFKDDHKGYCDLQVLPHIINMPIPYFMNNASQIFTSVQHNNLYIFPLVNDTFVLNASCEGQEWTWGVHLHSNLSILLCGFLPYRKCLWINYACKVTAGGIWK